MDKYQHIFSPFRIGNVEVKNRIEAAPMLLCLEPDGNVTKGVIEFYKSLARGGVAIVTVGDSAVDFDRGRFHIGELNLSDDRIIGGLSTLAEAIQRYRAKISIELNHAGRMANPSYGQKPIGPSPTTIVFGDRRKQVEQMNQDMIDNVIDQFASAAVRAQRAGFDMIFIHGGHGWLIGQFSSPLTNKRMDGYGGSLENRARFSMEILTEIRKRVGNKLAIEYRISADELIPGGMQIEETIEFIKLIQDKIDLIHVSLGTIGEPKYGLWAQPTYLPHNYNVHRAEMIKKAVQVPVTCVGSISDLEAADKIIAEGKADIVAMARAIIADPEIVNKTQRGHADDVRPCLRCTICAERPARFYPVRCAVNPVTGREVDYSYIRSADKKKKVTIVGGGPAGMEAAIIASSRGHQVILYEKEPELGGTIRVAASPSFKTDMKNYLDWLIRKTRQSLVEIRLSTEATTDSIEAEKSDVLILAVGAEPCIPDIRGINKKKVVIANDVNTGKVQTGKTVVVAGAGMVGCEIALHLVQQGRKVTIIDMIKETEIAEEAGIAPRATLLELLHQCGVDFKTEVKLEEITDKGVIIADKQWNRLEIPADTVVLSLGSKSRTQTVNKFQGLAPEVYVIGDCSNPRNLMAAIHEGFNVAVEI